jgi:hypothetical protein
MWNYLTMVNLKAKSFMPTANTLKYYVNLVNLTFCKVMLAFYLTQALSVFTAISMVKYP